MIVPDVNLLIHAYDRDSLVHAAARRWWEDLLNGTRPVGRAWVAALGFIRISTHRQILARPLSVAAACDRVRAWLARPALGTAGNLTTDAHLAALSIEHQAELHTTDADFARFPGLRWKNPLVSR